MVTLKRYQNESETAIPLIQAFWLHHSHADQTPGEAAEDLRAWTGWSSWATRVFTRTAAATPSPTPC